MPPEDDVVITELEEFTPTRVDGVGKGANGFPILMLKGLADGQVVETETTLGEVLSDLDKARTREDCDSCDGTGKVNDTKCGKCFGSGVKPMPGDTEKSLMEIAALKGTAPSGAPVPPPHDCPTCNGAGTIRDASAAGKSCPDCGGSGRDGQYNTDTVREGFGGSVSHGDPQGREKIDKSVEFCDDDNCDVCKADLAVGEDETLEKKRLKYKERQALGDSAFALPGRRYPIHDESHARNALARVSQYGTPEEKAKVRAAVHRRYPNIGQSDASKADGSVFSGPNPQFGAMATKVGDAISGANDSIMSGPAPGSPAWEGVDAATATQAAVALMAAGEKIREFAQRESIEMAAGEGNDIFDTFVAEQALCDVSHALGIMAQMAFHEGLEATKSVDGVEKAGRRLSMKTAHALTELRDHITNLLGSDDPANATTDDAAKAIEIDLVALTKELEDMTTDELTKMLDERDAKLVSTLGKMFKGDKAKKGKSAMDQAASVARAKSARSQGNADGDAAVADDDDLEDEASQGTNQSASGTRNANGGAKAVLTDEEIEAKRARKDAKKALKNARETERQAHELAAIKQAVTESKAGYEEVIKGLEARLAGIEGRVAPTEAVRTRPAEALKASAVVDDLQAKMARYENLAKSVSDPEMRTEYAARAAAARRELVAAQSV